ncbi:rhodanese-like domain-containing protein [Enterococcus alishanensis]
MDTILPADLERQLKKNKLTVLDVRDTNEYASGHIPNAINYPLADIENYQGAKDQPTYVVCQGGVRSKKAAKILQAKGYQVVNVTGGMNLWQGSLSKK